MVDGSFGPDNSQLVLFVLLARQEDEEDIK